MENIRLCIQTVKWLPIISTVAIIISFIFALLGMPLIINILSFPVASTIATCYMLFIFSKLFKFCKWHRILILNLFVVAVFSWINSLHRITSDLTSIWIVLLISGISIIFSTIFYSQRNG